MKNVRKKNALIIIPSGLIWKKVSSVRMINGWVKKH